MGNSDKQTAGERALIPAAGETAMGIGSLLYDTSKQESEQLKRPDPAMRWYDYGAYIAARKRFLLAQAEAYQARA
jgi:hypothetical protein